MQLQAYFVRDCELVAGWVPHACFLIIQPKQVMAQRRDSWQERKRKRDETTGVCTEEHSECDTKQALKALLEKVKTD